MKKLSVILVVVVLLLAGCTGPSEPVASNGVDESKNPVAGVDLSDLVLTDLDGNTIDGDYFKNNGITVVNLWATWCGPCVEEMPEFQKLAESGVAVLGIAIDSDMEEIKDLKKQLNITYSIVEAEEQLQEKVLGNFDYVPVTLFVDGDGIVKEAFIPGSTTYETLSSKVEEMKGE